MLTRVFFVSSNTGHRAYISLVGLLGLTLSGCAPVKSERPVVKQPQTSLHQAIFKRTDPAGKLLWQLRAEKVEVLGEAVQLRQIQGTFYHQQEPIYALQAPYGQVHQHSHFIQLQGPILVKDVRERITLRSQRLQWHPKTGQLIAQQQVLLQHPQFEMKGQRFQASTQTRQSRLSGAVTVKWLDRHLQLQAQEINWFPHQETLSAHSVIPARVTVQPHADQSLTSHHWQRVQAQRVELRVPSQQLVFDQAVEIHSSEPKMHIKSPRVLVSLTEDKWHSPQGMHIQYQGISARAKQGWLGPSQTLNLQHQVQVQGLPQQAQMQAQSLTWNMATQQIQARGQLVYQQLQPWMRMTGTKAAGNLLQKTLEVEGGEAVVEIVP